jgi:threonine/homoserine/homoserine lactone efflux protein
MMMRCDWTACAVRSVVYQTFRVVGVFVSFVSWMSWVSWVSLVSWVLARGWSGGFGSRRRAADVMCGGVLGGD